MKSKLLKISMVAALSLGVATPAFADGEAEEAAGSWSASLAVTSDYRFRGVSQSDRDPAVQGSIDFSADWFSAGVWASNIDFVDDGLYTDGDTSIEVDLYAAITHALSDSTEASLKAVYYWYPDADMLPGLPDYHYFELIGGLSHNFGNGAISLELAWSPDYFFATGDSIAVTGGLEFTLCDKLWFFDGGVAASGHLGYQGIDDNLNYGTPDYIYYDIGLAATAGMFTLDVRWVGTDLDEADCFGGLDWCEGGVVATGSLAFGG